jgi:hypothetical protein
VTNPIYPTLWIKIAVASPSPVAVTRRYTALIATVYTEHADATSFSAALARGHVGTALGVAVPPDRVVVPT